MSPSPAIDRRTLLQLLAGAGTLAVWAPRPALAAPSIYQQIWAADQGERGIPAIPVDARGDREQGFVKVDERVSGAPDHRLFAEVHIPEHKRLTYDLCKALLDNYRLDQTKAEDTTSAEAREMLALLEAITDSAPMAMARAYLEEAGGRPFTRDAWQNLIYEIWFRPYDDGRNRDLSGFEHVVVGEQKQSTVSGYHFWYKYYLDDWALLWERDDIEFDGARYKGRHAETALATPAITTLAFRWHAHDPDLNQRYPLYKPVGGFWVGCSIEGLLALGLVRFFERGHVETVIAGSRYQIDAYRSPDGQSLRTYFPRYLGPA